jgi:hypothetical protein
VKLDTDGFDCRILRTQRKTLSSLNAILFFEYDPHLTGLVGDDSSELISELSKVGYSHALVYDHLGSFLMGVRTDDAAMLADFHEYLVRSNGSAYADICAFPASDTGLYNAIRDSERGVAPMPVVANALGAQ